MQADRLESQMRVQLEIQEGIDLPLEQRDEELRQLRSQSQADGAQLAALSLQLQELVRKLDLSHLCFSLNFYFLMFLCLFPSMFSLANSFSIILFLIC